MRLSLINISLALGTLLYRKITFVSLLINAFTIPRRLCISFILFIIKFLSQTWHKFNFYWLFVFISIPVWRQRFALFYVFNA